MGLEGSCNQLSLGKTTCFELPCSLPSLKPLYLVSTQTHDYNALALVEQHVRRVIPPEFTASQYWSPGLKVLKKTLRRE